MLYFPPLCFYCSETNNHHHHHYPFPIDGVFERQIDVALWSGQAAAGDTASELIHSSIVHSEVSTPAGRQSNWRPGHMKPTNVENIQVGC